MNNGIFETVLHLNKDYVDALNRGASAEEQENLLTACRIAFDTMIRKAGLCSEYAEYCRMKNLK